MIEPVADTRNIAALLQHARAALGNNFSAALDARLLLQAAANLTHAEIIAAPEHQLNEEAATRFQAFITRRLNHEPISRILGRREFYGREFLISPHVLDPRADTETLVELALKHCAQGRFVDLGTGSGAIAITLVSENRNLSGIATDLSDEALGVARGNAERLGGLDRLSFHQGSWFSGIDEKFDIIVSNPPYIRKDAALPPDVVAFDPHLALFAGHDGFDAYREIARDAAAHLHENGLVAVEIGFDQSIDVIDIFKVHGFECVVQSKDLAGHVRAMAFKLYEPN